MSKFLNRSERLWKRRHIRYDRRVLYHSKHGNKELEEKWRKKRNEAGRWLRKRRSQKKKYRLRHRKWYRFDKGRVSRPWLWLLTTARKEGWNGSLYGPRTGIRLYVEQAALWAAYRAGTGSPAFPPNGPSRHLWRNIKNATWRQAVDTSDVDTLIRIARRHGVELHRPYGGEPWHVEAREKFYAK